MYWLQRNVVFVLLCFVLTAQGSPAANPYSSKTDTQNIQKQALFSTCDSWGTYTTDEFTVYQNLWGASAATSGGQCLTVNSVSSSDSFAWTTNWTWAGGPYNVKSYNNVAYGKLPIQLSNITSIPTTWDWSLTGTGLVCDVSYDIMTSSTSSGSNDFEIMVWLDAVGGAGPISSSGSAIATPTIDGQEWKLFSGPNGDTTVYSFVATSALTSFSGDILSFFTWLNKNEDFSLSQYLTVLESGTEPFVGTDAVLTTTSYKITVNT